MLFRNVWGKSRCQHQPWLGEEEKKLFHGKMIKMGAQRHHALLAKIRRYPSKAVFCPGAFPGAGREGHCLPPVRIRRLRLFSHEVGFHIVFHIAFGGFQDAGDAENIVFGSIESVTHRILAALQHHKKPVAAIDIGPIARMICGKVAVGFLGRDHRNQQLAQWIAVLEFLALIFLNWEKKLSRIYFSARNHTI